MATGACFRAFACGDGYIQEGLLGFCRTAGLTADNKTGFLLFDGSLDRRNGVAIPAAIVIVRHGYRKAKYTPPGQAKFSYR